MRSLASPHPSGHCSWAVSFAQRNVAGRSDVGEGPHNISPPTAEELAIGGRACRPGPLIKHTSEPSARMEWSYGHLVDQRAFDAPGFRYNYGHLRPFKLIRPTLRPRS